MVIVGMQAGAAIGRTWIGQRRRVRGRVRRRRPRPAAARPFAGLPGPGPQPLRAAHRRGSRCAGDGPARRDTSAGPAARGSDRRNGRETIPRHRHRHRRHPRHRHRMRIWRDRRRARRLLVDCRADRSCAWWGCGCPCGRAIGGVAMRGFPLRVVGRRVARRHRLILGARGARAPRETRHRSGDRGPCDARDHADATAPSLADSSSDCSSS